MAANLVGLPFTLQLPRPNSPSPSLPAHSTRRSSTSPFPFTHTSLSVAFRPAANAKSSSSSTSSAAAPPKPSSRGSGLKKPLDISPGLQQFLGVQKVSRADTMKLVWDYIKSHDLQHPDDRRRIVCDEKLKNLLGKDECNFLELAKLLNPHFLKSA